MTKTLSPKIGRREVRFWAIAGRRLKRERQAAGLSLKGFAELLARTRQSIINMEAGRTRWSVYCALRCAEVLKVPLAQLLPGDVIKPQE